MGETFEKKIPHIADPDKFKTITVPVRVVRIRVVGDPYKDGGILLGTNVTVEARIWNNQEDKAESEWVPLPCRSVEIHAEANSFITATVDAHVSELDLQAVLKVLEDSREDKDGKA